MTRTVKCLEFPIFARTFLLSLCRKKYIKHETFFFIWKEKYFGIFINRKELARSGKMSRKNNLKRSALKKILEKNCWYHKLTFTVDDSLKMLFDDAFFEERIVHFSW